MRKDKYKYVVLPAKHVTYGGQKRASLGFQTLEGARNFVKNRGLKRAVLIKRKF